MNRVPVTIQKQMLSDIDRVASAEQRGRSELIREALRRYLKANGREVEQEETYYEAGMERLYTV